MLRREFVAQLGAAGLLHAAGADPLARPWTARWIFPTAAEPTSFGVYHLRRTVTLDSVPARLDVHVSGDARYILYVNGRQASRGPARGDLYHWRYETVDIAPLLRPGRNVLAAAVWNDGPAAAVAQHSHRTAFLLQAQDKLFDLLNSSKEWLSFHNPAYTPIALPGNLWNEISPGYYAIGPMENFNAALYPWGWQDPAFDDSAWTPADQGPVASPRDARDAPSRWMLVSRPIPAMEETPIRLASVRSSTGAKPPAGFLERPVAFTIPPHTKATILLDQGHLTTAYPVVEMEGGRGAELTIRYAESLFKQLRPRVDKGNRNEIAGKEFRGFGDHLFPDGPRRTWQPLFWRTFRYVQLTIQTDVEPLTLLDLRAIYTGYPFEMKAQLDTGNPLHQKMLEVGFRTARLCAHESYMDCPYYEQLQYVGDTRIQALVSLYSTGDSRLMRNALEQIDSSRTPEGATFSRAPSVLQQYIPPFSLWWIGMLHDYWWYVDDPAFVKSMLPGVRAITTWYSSFLGDKGLLTAMPWWNYVDWVEKWPNGTPPCEAGLMPASINLQLVLALQWAAELEQHLGDPTRATQARDAAAKLAATAKRLFWSPEKKLYSEDLAHQHLSQHANVLAVLAGLNPLEQKDLIARVEADKTLYKCSVYFRYYLDRAMAKAGLGGKYLERLGTWEFMLQEGLSTWAEVDASWTRSDCHAWGASPNIEFFRTVLGVDSAAPGFKQVRVTPNLGPLKRASGVVPHPKGIIEVQIERTPTGYKTDVKLPKGVTLAPPKA